MAVGRWDPFRDLLSIQNEMNRLFGRTYGSAPTDVETGGTWAPALDVYETKERYVVVVELPGMTTGDVDITVEDNVISLKGERTFYEGVSEDAFHRVERRFGPFQRRIALPQQCDTARIAASMADGVLTIDVPKAETAKPKRIEVKVKE